jgi:hypothetical protein
MLRYELRGSRFRAPAPGAAPASRAVAISALAQPATVRWSRSAARLGVGVLQDIADRLAKDSVTARGVVVIGAPFDEINRASDR